jgi:hypothetical protein
MFTSSAAHDHIIVHDEFMLLLWPAIGSLTLSPCASQAYNFWYSSLPSSFLDSAIFRTALLKSSWLIASR